MGGGLSDFSVVVLLLLTLLLLTLLLLLLFLLMLLLLGRGDGDLSDGDREEGLLVVLLLLLFLRSGGGAMVGKVARGWDGSGMSVVGLEMEGLGRGRGVVRREGGVLRVACDCCVDARGTEPVTACWCDDAA